MPLVLNLHHEIVKKRAIKRRDPLKIAAAGIVAIVVGFAGYYLFQLAEAHSLNEDLARMAMEYSKLEPKAEAAKKREDELNASIRASDAMVKRVEGRFYWGPVLGTLARIVPQEVQVTKLSGDVSADAGKHCSITIDGVAASAAPRKTAEALRKDLNEQFSAKYKSVVSTFKSLEDSSEVVKLDDRPAKTVEFSIIVQLQLGEDAPPPPVYKGRKSS